jgi:hypothetical protein
MQASYLTEAKSTTYKQKRPREGSLWSAGQSRVNWRNWGPFWGLPTQSAHYLLERKELGSNLLHAAQRGGKQCSVKRPPWPTENRQVTGKQHSEELGSNSIRPVPEPKISKPRRTSENQEFDLIDAS